MATMVLLAAKSIQEAREASSEARAAPLTPLEMVLHQ